MERDPLYFLLAGACPRLCGGGAYRKTGVHPRLRKGMLFRGMRQAQSNFGAATSGETRSRRARTLGRNMCGARGFEAIARRERAVAPTVGNRRWTKREFRDNLLRELVQIWHTFGRGNIGVVQGITRDHERLQRKPNRSSQDEQKNDRAPAGRNGLARPQGAPKRRRLLNGLYE